MKTVAVLAAGLVLASCYRPEQNPKPPLELPTQFRSQVEAGQRPPPEKWWREFGDDQLSALVDAALTDNFQVKAAYARIEQARATASIAGAPLLPSVDATAGISRTQVALNPAQFGAGDASGQFPTSARFNNVSMSLAASYELDVWGRLRSGQKAAVLDAASRRDDLEALAISTAAEVAEAWFDLLRQRESQDLLERQLEVDETFLELVKLRAGQGAAGSRRRPACHGRDPHWHPGRQGARWVLPGRSRPAAASARHAGDGHPFGASEAPAGRARRPAPGGGRRLAGCPSRGRPLSPPHLVRQPRLQLAGGERSLSLRVEHS